MKNILVTSALPYANGPIHLGHLVEYIQTDIWVRAKKMLGNKVIYICADDAHGTPIMLRARQLGITAEKLIAEVKQEHYIDLTAFHIEFDNYHSTHSPENQEEVVKIYNILKQKKLIVTRNLKQMFDEQEQMFLPDRFVKGICPNCKSSEQYGDNCEACGSTYSPIDLISPYSVISNTTPVLKSSKHLFFDLPQCLGLLQQQLQQMQLQTEVRNKMNEWLKSGLQQWNISRDKPYFGFEIPDKKDKFFYVWLDAPIGYIASFKNLCQEREMNYIDFWEDKDNKNNELYHFIGKDILYFHCLFWQAILISIGYKTPDGIFAHGFLTLNDAKMSKSRGTFITASDLKQAIHPQFLRYYFATKLNSKVVDIDLSFSDFVTKINSDFIGKIVNLASRSQGFINKKFAQIMAKSLNSEDKNLITKIKSELPIIFNLFVDREYSQAIKIILAQADLTNIYFDKNAPWLLAKSTSKNDINRLAQVSSTTINCFALLSVALAPVLPQFYKNVSEFLNLHEVLPSQVLPTLDKIDLVFPLCGHKINNYKNLASRIEPENLNHLLRSG